MEISIDEEFKRLIPPLASEERSQLEANLIADGCREPLVVWQNGGESILIDGHNRFEICNRNSIKFKTQSKSFSSRKDALLWIIDNQFGRRNIADIDRIALANKKAEILRPIAKEQQKRKPESVSAILPKQNPIDTRKELAKSAGVGERTFDAGKLVLEAAASGEISEDEVERIRRKETSIHRVAKNIKEKRQSKQRQDQRKEAAEKAEPTFFDNIHVGDFRDHADKVKDGSLSLIFTDPPYDKKASAMLPGLAQFAASKLCDGGSLICYIGQTQMVDAVKSFSEKLRYWWTICCLHSGGANLMNEYGIRCGWKAVLWFVKNTRDDKETIVSDVMSGGREKSHHDWQQSQSEAEYWIKSLCPENGIVCDPFLGGGTTVAAAIKLNRKWVAFEKDHDQAVIAMSRCK